MCLNRLARDYEKKRKKAVSCAERSYCTPEFEKQVKAAEAAEATKQPGIKMALGSETEGSVSIVGVIGEKRMGSRTYKVAATAVSGLDQPTVVTGPDPKCACGLLSSKGKLCACLVALRDCRDSSVTTKALTPYAARSTTYLSQYPKGGFPLPDFGALEPDPEAKQPLLLQFAKGSGLKLEGRRCKSAEDYQRDAARSGKGAKSTLKRKAIFSSEV